MAMVGNYYIIEHPTKGTVWTDGTDIHFSWSGYRTDPEKARQFATIGEALTVLNRIPSVKVRTQCQIRQSPDRTRKATRYDWGNDPWKVVYPDAGPND